MSKWCSRDWVFANPQTSNNSLTLAVEQTFKIDEPHTQFGHHYNDITDERLCLEGQR
jgi:hypothetical protein